MKKQKREWKKEGEKVQTFIGACGILMPRHGQTAIVEILRIPGSAPMR